MDMPFTLCPSCRARKKELVYLVAAYAVKEEKLVTEEELQVAVQRTTDGAGACVG